MASRTIPRVRFAPIDLRDLSGAEAQAFTDLIAIQRQERLPDDPPFSLEENLARWRSIPSFVDVLETVAWHPTEKRLIGYAELEIMRTDQNRHLAEFSLFVAPGFRNQGLARQLLPFIIAEAEKAERTLLITGTSDRAPAGAAFMERLGAEPGLAEHINQLAVQDLDRDLVRAWLDRAPERASGFALDFWEGMPPEEQFEALAKLFAVMNSAPRGTLQVEDVDFTVEQFREFERSRLARGLVIWTNVARERTTGRLVGFTEMFWDPVRPWLVNQGGTGVLPEFRNKGLGRWLKAAMLQKLLQERPEVRFVRTGNADSNAAMLSINRQLGFRPYMAEMVWQIPTARVRAYLDARQKQEAIS